VKTKILVTVLALAVALSSLGWLETGKPRGHVESNTHNISTGHFNDGDVLPSTTTSIATLYGTAHNGGYSQAGADSIGIVYTIYACWDRNGNGNIDAGDEPIGQTTLTTNCADTDAVLNVASTATFLPSGYVKIGNELIKYYGTTGTTLLTNSNGSTPLGYTVSGAGSTVANGNYYLRGSSGGYPFYVLALGNCTIWYSTVRNLWMLSTYLAGPSLYSASTITGTWSVEAFGTSPAPTVTVLSGSPPEPPGYPTRGMNETTATSHSAGDAVVAVNAWDCVYRVVCDGSPYHAIGWNASTPTADDGTEGNLLQAGPITVEYGKHYLFKIRVADGTGNTNTEVGGMDVFHTFGPASYITMPPPNSTFTAQGLANNAVLSLRVNALPF